MRIEKTSIVLASLVLATFGVMSKLNSTHNNELKVASLQNGAEICFSRVAQSFSSRMIAGTGSTYLKNQFLQQTESCFSEAITLADDLAEVLNEEARSVFNSLAENIGSFHLALGSEENSLSQTPENLIKKNLSDKFVNLESKKEEAVESFVKSKNALEQTSSRYGLLVDILLGTSLFSILFLLFQSWKAKVNHREIEKLALEMLESEVNAEEAEELFIRALDNATMFNARRLLIRMWRKITLNELVEQKLESHDEVIGSNIVEENITASEADLELEHFDNNNNADNTWVGEQKVVAFDRNEIQVDPKSDEVEKIWNKTEQVASDVSNDIKFDYSEIDVETSVEKNLNIALDTLSDDLFKNGIIVEMDLGQANEFHVDGDLLIQVFHNVISHVIRSCRDSKRKQARNISVTTRKLARNTVLEFKISNYSFNDSAIEAFDKNEAYTGVDSMHYVGLETCKQLLKDENAGMTILNLEESEKEYASIQIAYHTETTKHVRSVKKGKKKELLKELKSSLS